MNRLEQMGFTTHARLKDIVGRGLIYNDNIALIELIKNSKDADSLKVELEFSNADVKDLNSQIVVRDFGKGMSLEDIKHKWLNMAYSAKKNQLKENGKNYAGNKGIGRFSCDRLGKKLDFYTFQDNQGYYFHIDWELFEVDNPEATIQDNKFSIYSIEKDEISKYFKTNNFTSGTILVISDLRDEWSYDKLKKLKKELEKFVISPLDKFSSGDFDVYIETNYLSNENKKEIDGLVNNKIFEELDFRTTSVEAQIDDNGKILTTILKHDGNYIFKIKEKNPYTKLKNLKTKIYFLNTAAKGFFTKKTGYKHLEYGSIFMFLNGFRVFPYGETGNDWLDIDRRKAQGYNRYIGTRDLIGYVSIEDNESSFIPVSAREGVVKNDAFEQLQSPYDIKALGKPGFVSKAFRRLEKFVVEGLDWDTVANFSANERFENIDPRDVRYYNNDEHILMVLSSVIYQGVSKQDVVDLEVNYDYLRELSVKEREAFIDFSNQLESKLKNNIDILPNKKYILKFLEEQNKKLKQKDETNISLIEQKEELVNVIEQKEETIREKDREIKKHKEKLKKKEEENLFLRSSAPKDAEHLQNLMHKINDDVDNLKQKISNYYSDRKKNKIKNIEECDEIIEKLHKRLCEIGKIADFATYRNYRMATEHKEIKIVDFIVKYFELLIEEEIHSEKLNLVNLNNLKKDFIYNVKPINLTILIDNIISNSKKHGASELSFSAHCDKNFLYLNFKNNGKKLASKYNSEDLFQKGFTTTKGSGLGLFHSKSIVNEEFGPEAEIKAIFGDDVEGFEIEVKIKCS